MNEEKKVALVTGASSGIGAATAEKLAGAGYQVVLVARREEQLVKVVEQIRANGGQAEYIPADLAQEETCQWLFEQIQGKFGRVDVLVNNAGMGWYGYSDEMSWQIARQMIEVNVASVTRLTLMFLPGMKKRKQGHIINISSIAGSLPNQGIALYSATKSYVDSFTTSLHRELRGTGVEATVIKPGAVTTPFFDTAAARDNGRRIPAEGLAIRPERVAGRILQVIQKPRRIVYVPRILGFAPFVELFFGWAIDLLGPLLLKRQAAGHSGK